MLQVRIFNEDENKLVYDGKLKTAIITGITADNDEGKNNTMKCTFTEANILEIASTIVSTYELIEELYSRCNGLKGAVEAYNDFANNKLNKALLKMLESILKGIDDESDNE